MTKQEKYHFIGIGGIGMSALACILLDRKIPVSGSDLSSSYVTDMLKKEGAAVHLGHAKEHLPLGSLVVYATGVPEINPELLAAKELKHSLYHRSDLVNKLAEGYKTLAVTGTHGKTTTSALLTHVLKSAGLDPAFAIGGVLPQYGRNGGHGKGDYFVVEACESDGTFLKYAPFGAIVTNINTDHLDHYRSQEALHQAFFTFIDHVSSQQHLIWYGDDPIMHGKGLSGISYGFGDKCILQLLNVVQKGWDTHFDIRYKNKTCQNITLPLIGRHNALNACAVFGLALSIGIQENEIRQAFSTFKGIKRRCEFKGDYQGIQMMDDYAHHPAELKTTLEGIRSAIGPDRRLIGVYQPHRYTRARDCLGDFDGVFETADEVLITNIYGAGEQPIDEVNDQVVFEDIAISNTRAKSIPRRDLVNYLADNLCENDLLVTLGAGDVTNLSKELLSYYKEINR